MAKLIIKMKKSENMNPYMHGGNPDAAFKYYGINSKPPVIDFSVNVNPLGPPEIIRRHWPDWISRISAYPSQNGRGLKKFYHKRFGVPGNSVLSGNGSIELIYLIPRALKIKKAVIFTPSFHDYQRACTLADADITGLPLLGKQMTDYLADDAVVALFEKTDAVFIGNPNNPTGSLIDSQTLLELAHRFPRTFFLIDEAFIQFLDNPEPYSLLTPDTLKENVIIFHSLTKFYALPGLRLGAAVSHPKTISRLKKYKEPWTVNVLAELSADVIADCLDYEIKSRRRISQQRSLLLDALNQIPVIDTFQPSANFLFARLSGSSNLDELIMGLLRKGIYIRDCRNFEGLDGNFFRLAVRGKDDNQRLIQAFADIFGNEND